MTTAATRTISFTLNGEPVSAAIATHHTLLEVVRDTFSFYGARESCGQGLCGCCTLIVDGRAVSGCLYLAAFADGTRVETIELLDQDGTLDPVQEAFIEHGAFQCGFCTPGFVLMVKQLLDEYPDPDLDRIRDYLAGNLCRCAAYPEIIQASRRPRGNDRPADLDNEHDQRVTLAAIRPADFKTLHNDQERFQRKGLNPGEAYIGLWRICHDYMKMMNALRKKLAGKALKGVERQRALARHDLLLWQ